MRKSLGGLTVDLRLSRRLLLSGSAVGAVTGSIGPSLAEATEPEFAAKLRPLIEQERQALSTPGVMVLVDLPDQGRWTAAFGVSDLATRKPMSTRNHMHIGSITKTFTATAILLLVDRGMIGLDDAVSTYKPDVPNGANITLRQILDMTSGLFNTTEDVGLNAALDAHPEKIWDPQRVIEIALAHPPYFAPGGGFHYANTNYDILGQIVATVSGMDLPSFFHQYILQPLGLGQTKLPSLNDRSLPRPYSHGYNYGTNTQGNEAYLALLAGDAAKAVIPDPNNAPPTDATHWSTSYTWASGGMISTLHDMSVWAKALGTGALLKPATFQQRTTWTPYAPYGLGITESIGPMQGHSGAVPGFQSVIGYDPKTGAIIVVLANLQSAPEILLSKSLPADAIGQLIYTTLFDAAG
jgi:D-alanyl-D-alanine carboxypeptidase